ncbi:MAG TPA: AP endonuclease [Rhizobiales bacterium]|nr:AP endonuclease [Hyphomicrobiales bacterium]
MHASRRATLAAIALVLPAALSLPLVAGFLGSWHPALDSFAHLRAHLAVSLALAALPALFLPGIRRVGWTALLLGAAAFSSTLPGAALPGVSPVSAAFHAKDGNTAVYRLLQLNLRFDNRTPEKVLSLIGRLSPDVVTLNEVSRYWTPKLSLLENAYPYRILCAVDSNVGATAVLSRRPFVPGTAGACHVDGSMSTATIDFGGRPVAVAALHLEWPWPFDQPAQIGRLAPHLAALAPTALVAGDLNAVPWSHAVRRIAAAGGLARAPAAGPTWLWRRLPVSLRPWIGLTIDHVFTKGAIAIHSVTIAEPVGSDHAPLLVEFSLPRPPSDEREKALVRLPEDGRPAIGGRMVSETSEG